jgi:DNA replication and repair protein RecF
MAIPLPLKVNWQNYSFQLIDPQSTDIIDHGAKPRRQLLDWLMFHVEPEFYFAWQYYSRALKQRNSLLKHSDN